jgi:Asp-tRNA(Asn)/Glu-tRNA(Gln) amidotransferase A subunit family amidase
MDADELCYRPATELARDVATKRLSRVEVADVFLTRIERLNPRIGAYCTVVADEARAAARRAEAAVMRGDPLGPLHGVPVSIKDLILIKGIRTTRGSKLYEHAIPDQDAPVVERLRATGAIVPGKTNTPELGWKGVTDNLIFGPTRNPWNLERTPGGLERRGQRPGRGRPGSHCAGVGNTSTRRALSGWPLTPCTVCSASQGR